MTGAAGSAGRGSRALVLLALLLLVGALTGCAAPRADGGLPGWVLRAGDGPPVPVTLPAHLDGSLPPGARAYDLETDVELAPELRDRDLELAIAVFHARPTLDVNGSRAASIDRGLVDRHRRAHLIRFHVPRDWTSTGRLHLTLSVPVVWAHSTWIGAVPRLVPAGEGLRDWIAIDAFNRGAAAAAVATVAFVALVYGILALSFSGRQRWSFALFALGAVLNLGYPAMALGLTQPLFGVHEIAVVGTSLSLAAVCAIYSTAQYFQMPTPGRGWLGWGVFCIIAAVLGADPFRTPRTLAWLVVATTLANTAAQTHLVWRLRNHKNRPANLRLISLAWILTAALGLPDFLVWMGESGALAGVQSGSLGVAVIFLFQIVALLRDHIRSVQRGETLNLELAERIAAIERQQHEVERLNDDLRRQIAARSRHLAESLSRTDEAFTSARPGPRIGDVVEGRYEVRRLLGTGGMGAVHEVVRRPDGAHFAMKVLSRAHDPLAHARFAREAQIAANVKHPNVVAIVDFDVAREGFIFLVMDLVEGITLQQAQKDLVLLERALYILGRVSEGLAAIHAQGVVHRDLKPANVLLAPGTDPERPAVKIADFGVSSLIAEELQSEAWSSAPASPPPEADATVTFQHRKVAADAPHAPRKAPDRKTPPSDVLTRPGVVFGTPFYIAPELARIDRARPSADIFSFGSIAYQLLSGVRPFSECPLRAAFDGRVLPVPTPLEVRVPGIDPNVAAVLDRALHVEPDERPTAGELASALAPWTAAVPGT